MTSKPSSDAAAGPSDKEMKNVILSTLGSAIGDVRPNKLRKLTCKQLKGATWTQFAKCLDALTDDENKIKKKEKGGETFLILVGRGKDNKVKSAATISKNDELTTGDEAEVFKEEMRIPRVVALYLHKKKHLKLKNIETNTKTKLTVFGQLDGKQTDASLANLHTLQIAAEVGLPKEDETQKDAEKLAKKHIEVAKNLVLKIVNAQKLHPERFAPKRSGGTFDEQTK